MTSSKILRKAILENSSKLPLKSKGYLLKVPEIDFSKIDLFDIAGLMARDEYNLSALVQHVSKGLGYTPVALSGKEFMICGKKFSFSYCTGRDFSYYIVTTH